MQLNDLVRTDDGSLDARSRIGGTLRQRQFGEILEQLRGRVRAAHGPESGEERDLFETLARLARVNTAAFKQESAALCRYVEHVEAGRDADAGAALAAISDRARRLYLDEPSMLGRRPQSLPAASTLSPSPRLRPEVLIDDKDYVLQRCCVDLTNNCNYRCRKCCRSDAIDPKRVDLDFDLLTKCVDEALSLGVQDLALMGGEPTLYQKFDDVLRYFLKADARERELPFIVILFTNGTKVYVEDNPERRDLIRRSKFLDVWFTMDTLDPDLYPQVHGCSAEAFGRVTRNLAIAIEDGLAEEGRLALTYPLFRDNLGQAEEVWRFCRKHHIKPRFTFMCNVGRAKERFGERGLSEEEKQNVREAITAVDASLGIRAVTSNNGIGVDPFKAVNFLAVDAEGKTWDFYANESGLDVREHTIEEIWAMNTMHLADRAFLEKQLDSTYKITREFAERRLKELDDAGR